MRDESALEWSEAELSRCRVDVGFTGARSGVDTQALCRLATECNYDLRALIERMGTSPRQLQRTFRTALRCTPRDWLREQRLQAARRLLATSPSVKQVAFALGFRQESQFCRDFKARFGYRPSRDLPTGIMRQIFLVRGQGKTSG